MNITEGSCRALWIFKKKKKKKKLSISLILAWRSVHESAPFDLVQRAEGALGDLDEIAHGEVVGVGVGPLVSEAQQLCPREGARDSECLIKLKAPN